MRITEALGFPIMVYGSIAIAVLIGVGLGYLVYRMW